jgi:hypothetical protein
VGDAIQPCNNSTPAGKGAHVLAIRRYMHTVVHRIAQQLADLLIQQNMHASSVHMQISGGKEAEKQLCKLTN